MSEYVVRAHAALVYDGDEVVAWCEYGNPDELPNIYHRKQYEEELDILPDYLHSRQGSGQLRHAPHRVMTSPQSRAP